MCIKELKFCRLCGSPDLPVVVNLGVQVLSGVFPKYDKPDPISAPLTLVQCQSCGLVQQGHSVKPSLLYGDTYGYRSGINKTMRDHLQGIVESLEEFVDLLKGDVVLDIGSNDSTLLNFYREYGIRRIGFDPSGEKFKEFYSKDTILIPDFFNRELFNKASEGKKAIVVTSIAMLYDLENPLRFISDVKDILAENGIWVTEQSYMPTMVEKNMFDTICHEHMEYYGFTQLVPMLDQFNLRIFSFSFNDVNGGSVQLWICHKDAMYLNMNFIIDQIIEKEKKDGYDTVKPFVLFNKRINKIKKKLISFINSEVSKGKTFHLLGASTKGNVLLQFFGLDNIVISYASERNPIKYYCHTPGTNILIIPEFNSRSLKPDYYLVLPWHFKDEIVEREKEYLNKGGKLVFPLPEIEIVGDKNVRCL